MTRREGWAGTMLAVGFFALAWLALASPWLSGTVTIPYDAKAHFQAQIQFLANALHSGQSPFWAPNVFAGSPQIADPQSLIFSPAFLLAWFEAVPSFRAVDTYVLAMLGLGGLAIIMLFHDRGWHPAGAIVAALAFAFGASAAWRVQHIGQIQSYVLFGIALWLVVRTLDRHSWRAGIAAGAAIGTMLAEPNQVALLAIYLLAAYVAAHVLSSAAPRRELRAVLLPLGATAVTAIVLSAVPVLLTYLFVASSSRAEIPLTEAARGSLHPASLLTLLVGDLFGARNPAVPYWGPFSEVWDRTELTLSQNMSQLYIGVLPVLAILTAGLTRKLIWRPEIRFYTIATIAMIIYALGRHTPLFRLMFDTMPGVDLFRRPADATFLIGGTMSIVGGYLVHLAVTGGIPKVSRLGRAVEIAVVASLLLAAIALAVDMDRLSVAWWPIESAGLWLVAAVALMAALPRLIRVSPALAVALPALLMTWDLAVNNGPNESTALPVTDYAVLQPGQTNDTIILLKKLLKQPPGSARRDRVELVGMGFAWPNAALVHGFDHVLGYNPLRLSDISRGVGAGDTIAGPDQRIFTPLFPSYHSMLANLLCLRFIASGIPIEKIDTSLPPGALHLIAHTRDGYVYENPAALPRVLFATDWRWADFETLMKDGEWPIFDPTHTVLLDQFPGQRPIARLSAGHPLLNSVSLTMYRNTVVEVRVEAAQPGFLVLNDVWHPWWTAEVDGVPTEILKANVLFRAVQVPVGRHVVRFDFKPLAGALNEISHPHGAAPMARKGGF